MKEIIARIDVFETKILDAVERIRYLQKDNEKLIEENKRLKKEVNQLLGKVGNGVVHILDQESKKSIRDNYDINIEHVKNELDWCIDELNKCITLVKA